MCTGLCVCAPVCTSLYMYLCVHVCLCACAHARLRLCVAACLCPRAYMSLCTYPCARLPMSLCVHSLSTSLCVHMCLRVYVGGSSVSCCSAVQHLTPHTIRGIPAILGTRPRQFWEKRFLLEGMGMFPFMVASATAASRLASTCRHSLACLRVVTKHACSWVGPGRCSGGGRGPGSQSCLSQILVGHRS